MGYTEIYVIAEALCAARAATSRETSLSRRWRRSKDYRVSMIASGRTFTDWHHIGNLQQSILVVQNQKWVPIPWQAKRESEILATIKK